MAKHAVQFSAPTEASAENFVWLLSVSNMATNFSVEDWIGGCYKQPHDLNEVFIFCESTIDAYSLECVADMDAQGIKLVSYMPL